MTEEKREKVMNVVRKSKKVLNIVVDILLYPLIFLSLITSVVAITARDNSEVKQVFGHSVVTVLTGSMQAGGFSPKDIVFLKETKPEKIKASIVENAGTENQNVVQLGDVIAFYKYTTGAPSKSSLTPIQDTENLPEVDENVQKMYDPSMKQNAIKAKVDVIFHRVVAIYMADDGTFFFETRGDSNGIVKKQVNGIEVEVADWTKGIDSLLVSEYLVVGKYIKAPTFITSSLQYMITPTGMFWVIIVPLAIIVFLQIIELMTILFDMATEKKVLAGTLSFDSEESIKAKIGRDMEVHNKVYFYDITASRDKERVKLFLWENYFGEAKKGNKAVKEKPNEKAKVEQGLKIYSSSRDAYWDYWISNAPTNFARKKMILLRRNANIITKARDLNVKK